MSHVTRLINRIQGQFSHISLFQRIALGNTFIIIVGAIAGTLITRHLARKSVDWWLIFFFAAAGILLSLGINFWILRHALRPLNDLRLLVERLVVGDRNFDLSSIINPDSDTIQLARSLDKLVTEIEVSNRRLRAFSERAISAQEDERMNIARSLHDDTGQALAMLIISLDRLDEQIPEKETKLKKQLAEARGIAANALGELRHIVFGLRPTILDDLGLTAAIRWYVRTNLEKAGVRVIIKTPRKPIEVSSSVMTALFRITQEAINNIVRHAHAKKAMISLHNETNIIYLSVEDDGCGFNMDQTVEHALSLHKLGLLGIRERAELLGGKLIITSTPDHGTRLDIRIPCQPLESLENHDNPNPIS